MNEQKNNGRGIFYGVIGVATLVVAIIGATFAYFTATAGDANTITGNMATVSLGLNVTKVTKVDEKKNGMIPMSSGMVEEAVNPTTASNHAICEDDNGNAVCQIYKIVVTNNSTAGVFVDGYVALTGGSGNPTDYTTYKNATAGTTMRWAQVFCSDQTEDSTSGNSVKDCSTGGTQTLADADNITKTFTAFTNNTEATLDKGAAVSNILSASSDILDTSSISGSTYDTIKTNYIRVSDHKATEADANTGAQSFNRTNDLTSALVFSRNIAGKSSAEGDGVTDTYYIVVWLAETGTNQTAGSTGAGAATETSSFFSGNVTFLSAQGSEVSATFAGLGRIPASDNTNTQTNVNGG